MKPPKSGKASGVPKTSTKSPKKSAARGTLAPGGITSRSLSFG